MDRFCKSILSKGSGVVGNFKVNVAWRKKKELAMVLLYIIILQKNLNDKKEMLFQVDLCSMYL